MCGDPTDLDGNGRGRVRSRSESAYVFVNAVDDVLARRSLRIGNGLNGLLTIGEDHQLCRALLVSVPNELCEGYLYAVELSNVYR